MSTYSSVQLGVTHEMGSMMIDKQKLEWKEAAPGTRQITVNAEEIKNIEWLNIDRKRKMMKITFTNKKKEWLRFIGFAGEDEVSMDNAMKNNLGKGLSPKSVNLSGQSWGQFVLRGHDMVCRTEKKEILFTVPYHSISQSVIQSRNEISLELKTEGEGVSGKENDGDSRNSRKWRGSRGDHLCEIRMFIPDDEEGAAYEEFHDTLMKKAKLENDSASMIAWFKNITFRVPTGNKGIYFYPKHFLFRSDTFAYRIKYGQIRRLFVFEQPGDKVAFLVCHHFEF